MWLQLAPPGQCCGGGAGSPSVYSVALSSGITIPDLTTASVCCGFTALKMFSNNPQVFLSHTIAWLVTAQLNPYLRRLIKTRNRASHKALSLPASRQKCLSLPHPPTTLLGLPLAFAAPGFDLVEVGVSSFLPGGWGGVGQLSLETHLVGGVLLEPLVPRSPSRISFFWLPPEQGSSASAHWTPKSTLPPSWDNQKCLQALPDVPHPREGGQTTPC